MKLERRRSPEQSRMRKIAFHRHPQISLQPIPEDDHKSPSRTKLQFGHKQQRVEDASSLPQAGAQAQPERLEATVCGDGGERFASRIFTQTTMKPPMDNFHTRSRSRLMLSPSEVLTGTTRSTLAGGAP
jgi:hypothetical protein